MLRDLHLGFMLILLFFAQRVTTVKLSELQVSKNGGTKRMVNFCDIMESGGSIMFNTYEEDAWTSDATLQLYGDEILLPELIVEKGEKAMRFEANLDGIDVLKLNVWSSTSHRVGVGNVTLMMLE